MSEELNGSDLTAQPTDDKNRIPLETAEQKAERLLQGVGKVEFISFQERSSVALRDGSAFKVKEYLGDSREYEPDDLIDKPATRTMMVEKVIGFVGQTVQVEKSSTLVDTQGAVEALLLQHGQVIRHDPGGGMVIPPKNQLFSLVAERDGSLIIQGGGSVHLDSQGGRPNLSSYKVVFHDQTIGEEFLSWLKTDPGEAIFHMLHRSIDKYTRDGSTNPPQIRKLPLLLYSRGFKIDRQAIKDMKSGNIITKEYGVGY